MNFKSLIFFFCLTPIFCYGQRSGIRIMPEGGLSIPVGDFKAPYTFGKQGAQIDIHMDKFWGKFGIGLLGGLSQNGTQYQDQLPTLSGNPELTRTSVVSKDTWKQFLFGLGPVFKLDISSKFSLDLSSKFGFGSMVFPDYKEILSAGDPVNQDYKLYETKHGEVEKKLNPMLRSAIGLSFHPSEKIAVSLGANYTALQNVLHSYSYLDANFTEGMTNEEILHMVRTSPTVTDVMKCNFNTVGITLGIGIILGGKKDKDKEKEKMDPPISQYLENGSTISPKEADSLTMVWLKQTPNVEGANYNL